MITSSIVLFRTKREELCKVLDGLLRSDVDKVYLVDNSPDDALRDVAERSPRVEYLFGHGNVGYGSAHNIAIRKAMSEGADYHAVVNPDICFDDGTIEALSAYMDRNPDVGQIMPKVVYPDGTLQYLCKKIPTPADLIFRRFAPPRLVQGSMDRFQLKFTGYDSEMNVPFLSGCFMFFRVSALREIGLFDERFFMYGEDTDITRRMHEKYRTMFYPGVTVVHVHAAESKSDVRMLRVHIVNMIKYFNKWGWIFDSKRRRYNRRLLRELRKP